MKPARFPPLCTGNCALRISIATVFNLANREENGKAATLHAGSQETLPAATEATTYAPGKGSGVIR